MKPQRARIALTTLLLLVATAPQTLRADPVSDALHARLEELQFSGDLHIGPARIAAGTLLPAVYAYRNFAPLWTDEARIDEFLALVTTAPEDGLDTRDYHLEHLGTKRTQAATGGPLAAADLDILLTDSLIRYGYHQLFGKVNAAELDANINFNRDFLGGREPVTALPQIIASPTPLAEQLENSVHRSGFYRSLRGHLAEHRRIAAAGGWPEVPVGATLHPDDDDPRVLDLRRRLVMSGDLPVADDTGATLFDDALRDAVIRFQRRHALDADGVVGQQSYAALNVPVAVRIDQIRLALERLRWVRGDRAERFVAVNIAGFRVFFLRRGEIVMTTRAMVGTTYRQTPIFRGTMSYLEINPTWTVPPGILRNDVLPAIRQDPGYLQAKNMSVIDRDGKRIDPATIDWQAYQRGIPWSIRQEPGPNNALGEIKLIFPNRHFVFLHDTPSRSLFARSERTFSSGCIRVEDPFALASLIMNDPGQWDQAALEAVRDTRATRRINTPKIPVLILYLTASIERDGSVRFLKDVYGRDPRLLEALDGPVVIGGATG